LSGDRPMGTEGSEALARVQVRSTVPPRARLSCSLLVGHSLTTS
jgi:hypothetical protein